MKKLLLLLIAFMALLMLSGCSWNNTPAQSVNSKSQLSQVSCNEIYFYLDPALGNGCKCETVPESSSSDIPMDIFIYPTHTEITIKNYPLDHTQCTPQILIYPVNRYTELLPDVLPDRVSTIRKLISSGNWSGGEMPFLPPIPQTQTFFNHEANLAFVGGHGCVSSPSILKVL